MTVPLDHHAALPAGYLASADQVIVRVNGSPLRALCYGQSDAPIYFVHASLPDGREHEVSVQIKRHFNTWSLHPQRLGIRVTQEKKALRFTVRGQPHLVVESDGLGYLLPAFDPAQDEPAGDGVARAAQPGVRPDAGTGLTPPGFLHGNTLAACLAAEPQVRVSAQDLHTRTRGFTA